MTKSNKKIAVIGKFKQVRDGLFFMFITCQAARSGYKYYALHDPKYVDELAFTFPKLKIALCHGGWPFVAQACHVVMQHENVYLSPDVYMMSFTPGYQDYVTAANY